MNENRLKQFLLPRPKTCSRESRAASAISPPIQMTGLYDSARHRAAATRCLTRVARSLGSNTGLHSEWWSLDAFARTAAHNQVVDCSEHSMVLWFAGDGRPDQIDVLESWLNECHWTTDTPRALVTVLEFECIRHSMAKRIQIIAAGHDLQLFSGTKTLSAFCEGGPSSWTEVMQPWPHHVPHSIRPNQIRFHGINE